MSHNVDWDKFHKELAVYMQSIDSLSPLGRWVMNWVDVPPAVTVALYRSLDERPVAVGQRGLFAISLGAPLPPDFFNLPKLVHTYDEIVQADRKRQQNPHT